MKWLNPKYFSSFTWLNITQFLGALNDNIYKLLIVFFCIQIDGVENSHKIVSLAGAIFVIPFLLFSSPSGTLADRFSKRNIIFLTKVLELAIMLGGLSTFYFNSQVGSYFVLFLMATQSAIFGPSKYGILPELVTVDKISRANGLLTSFTFLAIILGTFLASFITQITGRNFVLAALCCVLISLVGLYTGYKIEYTPPAGSSKRFDVRFLREVMQTLKQVKQFPSLLTAIFGSAFFMFVGAFTQLNMIPFSVQSLGLTDLEGGYLFLLTAIGIGVGSVIAGQISGKNVELALVPLAGLGMAIGSFFLDYYANNIFAVIPLVMFLGLFGGIYMVPLDSYTQIASPKETRGQVIGTTNFVGFFGVLLASLCIYFFTELFGLSAEKGFMILGYLTTLMTLVLFYQFFDYVTRFIGMLFSRLHFDITFHGKENIPDTAAIYICRHTAWNDTLLMLGSQRRRMRFFIEEEKEHTKWLKRIYKTLRIVHIPSIETFADKVACAQAIEDSLKKGISVCILTNTSNLLREIESLLQSDALATFISESKTAAIPVTIDKGQKLKSLRYFDNLYKKFRVPASIHFG